VAGQDPLHELLSRVLWDRLGVRVPGPAFRAFRLSGSNEVYGYEEKTSRARVIGKFYGPRFGWDRDRAATLARREYEGLQRLRGYQLTGSPHHVICPLAVAAELNAVLVVEYWPGEEFSHAISRATRHGDDGHLYRRLTALAWFLATQHNRTANGARVDFAPDWRYFDTVVGRLEQGGRLGRWEVQELAWLGAGWAERPRMWQDRQVWLHGDATPANFLFGQGQDVAAIDLERMKRGDRMFDVGRVAGELQHAFMQTAGGWRGGERFIGHFLWEYACHFPDRHQAFTSITGRLPYYMALNLLRIAGNDYLGPDYRHQLVAQAKNLLQAA
jgi:aminoglycoside phosphotransferase (APT) family kinase protein